MRIFTTAIVALFVSAAFIACKKDSGKSDKPAAAVEGLYDGKYGFDDETPHIGYTLDFKAGGVIEEIGQSSRKPVGRGTWKLNGNTITASYAMLFQPYGDYFIVAAFDASSKTISGTWGYTSGGTDGGKFTLSRK